MRRPLRPAVLSCMHEILSGAGSMPTHTPITPGRVLRLFGRLRSFKKIFRALTRAILPVPVHVAWRGRRAHTSRDLICVSR